MNRYLVFSSVYDHFDGGWNDFKMDFKYLDVAIKSLNNEQFKWCHIFDLKLKKIVYEKIYDTDGQLYHVWTEQGTSDCNSYDSNILKDLFKFILKS
jgi:hypothetical protein